MKYYIIWEGKRVMMTGKAATPADLEKMETVAAMLTKNPRTQEITEQEYKAVEGEI